MADKDTSRPGFMRRRIGPAFDESRPGRDRLKAAATGAALASVAVGATMAGGDAAAVLLAHQAIGGAAATDLITAGASVGGAAMLTGGYAVIDITSTSYRRTERRLANRRGLGHLRTVLGMGAVTTGVAAVVAGLAPGLEVAAAATTAAAIGVTGAAVGTEITRRVVARGLPPARPQSARAIE